MNRKRLLVIATEGETDAEFYKKVLSTIKLNNDRINFNFDKIDYICAQGISGFAKKIPNKFKNKFATVEFANYEKIVCLCYDLDVFSLEQKPPVDRDKLENDLKAIGVDQVIHIKADKTIEDFFLIDIEGIKRFLRLPRRYKLPNKSGLELLKQMFKDASKTYFKGERVSGLVDALDICLILTKICKQLSVLCNELGYKCSGDKCKRNNH